MEISSAIRVCIVLFTVGCSKCFQTDVLPLVLTSWPYENAVNEGWNTILTSNKTPVDAVEVTGHACEKEQCLYSVGFGGSPDENGETTLDAMIMDGNTHNVGGVGGLRRVNSAISVARYVLDNTEHTLLVGDQATQFAIAMGFQEENLTTNYSQSLWETWKAGKCQPNFRKNFTPDPRQSCGPYTPNTSENMHRNTTDNETKCTNGIDNYNITNGKDDNNNDTNGKNDKDNDTNGKNDKDNETIERDENNHDTIGIIVIDTQGNIAAGASTNGLSYKIPGRVGDSPIAGAGAYADSDIGAATCTGNGDIMMRFLPSYQAVTLMGTGMSPTEAATVAIETIARKYPTFLGAVVAADKTGEFGAACNLWTDFQITYKNPTVPTATVLNITCN